MNNEAFEKWAKDQDWSPSLDIAPDGRYCRLQTERCLHAFEAGHKSALTEAEKACDAVCTEKVNDWGDGYNHAAIVCSAEIRRLRAA